MGFGVWGLGFAVWGLRFGVWGLGFGVWGLGFGVWGLGFGVWGLGFNRTEVCYVEGDTGVVCTLSRMLLAEECASGDTVSFGR